MLCGCSPFQNPKADGPSRYSHAIGRTTVMLKMLDPISPAACTGHILKNDQVAAAGARWSMANMAFLMAGASFFERAWASEGGTAGLCLRILNFLVHFKGPIPYDFTLEEEE